MRGVLLVILTLTILSLSVYAVCPGTINTTTVLGSDIDGTNASGSCITIAANVTLDCNGFSIDGPGSDTAITLSSNDAEIIDCNINNWASAIAGEITCNGTRIAGNTITNSTGTAVELVRCSNIDVQDNQITTADIGLYLVGRLGFLAYNGTIENNTIDDTSDAGIQLGEPFSIFAYGTVNTEILSNTVMNAGTAMREYGGSNNQINHNYFEGDIALEMDLFNTGVDLYNNTFISDNTVVSIIETDSAVFNDSEFIGTGDDPTIISIDSLSSGGVDFFESIMRSNGTTWFSAFTLGGNDVNFSGLIIEAANISMVFSESFLLPEDTIDEDDLNISSQTVFLDASTAGILNQTTNITFNAPGLSAPDIYVDINDNGTFEVCNAPRCTNEAYGGGEYFVTVSGFTTYQLIDIASNPEAIPEFGDIVWILVPGILIGLFMFRRRE